MRDDGNLIGAGVRSDVLRGRVEGITRAKKNVMTETPKSTTTALNSRVMMNSALRISPRAHDSKGCGHPDRPAVRRSGRWSGTVPGPGAHRHDDRA